MKTNVLKITNESKTELFVGKNLVGQLVASLASSLFSSLVIITDEEVKTLYGNRIKEKLSSHILTHVITVPSGEAAKNIQVAIDALGEMQKKGVDRKGAILAIGGGAVSDAAGFIASVYKRGIPWIIYPTTLLSQVDAAIGGKTAVNLDDIKNIVGTFSQPISVYIDMDTLRSLPDREFSSGMAEVVKYAVSLDKTLIPMLTKDVKNNQQKLEEVIFRCVQLKCRIVAKDEKETLGLRQLLNFGHTLGHAIESVAGLGKYSHGEAISIGMLFATKLSTHMGLATPADVKTVQELLLQYNLPVDLSLSHEKLIETMGKDKKNVDGSIKWVLINGLGNAIGDQFVQDSIIKAVLKEM